MPEDLFVFPTSFSQQRLWFLDQLNPGSTIYNLPMGVRLLGPLDSEGINRTFSHIIQRHEILRTTFSVMDGQPVQVITSAIPEYVAMVDLSALTIAKRDTEASRLAAQQARNPFNLACGPLLLARIVRLNQEDHMLLLTMHHIISDGWSKAVLIREVSALYDAYTQGRSSPLAELPIQYADYVIWQREWLQGDRLESELAYWRSQLAGAATLNLQTDHLRPDVQTFPGADYAFILPASLSIALRELSQQQGVTLFMTSLAAFQVLLARYSGQEDIVVGTAVAGRTRAETEQLIGLFINTLALRTDLSGEPSFRELLQRVKRCCLDSYAHQDVPFEKLVEELRPERDLSRSPLVQVMFTLQNVPREELQLGGLSLKQVTISNGVSRFELSLSMTESGDRLYGMVEYNTDLFDGKTVQRMMDHFKHGLEAIVDNPLRRITELQLLSEAERQQLIEWNATAKNYPHDSSIHELFEQQVLLSPGEIALSFEGRQLTYRELNQRANQLARYLRKLGVGPEILVGLCMKRSIEMVVGLLGILKAGGAYVPLDSRFPTERLSFMVKDARICVLLTQEHLYQNLFAPQVQIALIDTEWDTIAQHSQENLPPLARGQNLAYVIYTSGSTGQPKGVMIEHRNVLNFFAAMDDRIGEEQPGVWLALTSISFDISVLELLWTLTRGFHIVVQDEHELTNNIAESGEKLSERGMQFSLFYFASDGTRASDNRYRLLINGARFADEHDFTAVWTPERHFHAFGDLYPNPALSSAALSTITRRVQIRAGSVVAPLHHPVRVAEEWAIVDNLSGGRVGVSFASGWHAADFIFAPDLYRNRRQVMIEQIDLIKRLWRGEKVAFRGGADQEVEIGIFPRPVQPELPVWLTSGGTPDTFRKAGEIGANLLTHLLGQQLPELEEKIQLYRKEWRKAGHQGEGHVTLMLHTFVGRDLGEVREKVREPFKNYLASSVDLIKNFAKSVGHDPEKGNFTEDDMHTVLDHAFNRYFNESGLMGTPEMCLEMIERLKVIGVDEVACLIDFGVEYDSVMQSLQLLDEVRRRSNEVKEETDYSIAAQLRRRQVTHLQCTPSLASLLGMDQKTIHALGGVRKLLLGGEALSAQLANQFREVICGEVYNMYGPTETTIWSTTHRVSEEERKPSIGRPIANTEVYILGKKLELAPVGVTGAIYIGGTGVARGYLNRAGLSAEKFIPHPFSLEPGARLYSTGDFARYLANGEIEFLGRADQQVKVRGHRIELGEIEVVLGQHPHVRECVVIAEEDGDGNQRLIAYVVPEKGEAAASIQLRDYIKQRLPDPLVPAIFVSLESLPKTANGKVDRRALLKLKPALPNPQESFVEPKTPMEEILAGIWAQVLKVDQISMHDNFFELGGHSLLATQLIFRIRDAFAMEIPLQSFFERPTIAGLSEWIEAALRAETETDVPPIVPVPRDGRLPLSYSQERMWLLNQSEPDDHHYNMPNVILLRGPLRTTALKQACSEFIRRQESFRTTFVNLDGEPVLAIAPPKPFDLPIIDISEAHESARREEATRLILDNAWRPFNFAQGPPVRIMLLRLSESDHMLLVTMHHIISDGWSVNIILRELRVLYDAFSADKPSPLPELSIQYADFAVWQRQNIQGKLLERLLAYWTQQLSGDLSPLELATDRPRHLAQNYHVNTQSIGIPLDLSEEIKRLSRHEGCTLYMTFLAAFKVLLSFYTKQYDVIVSSHIATRNHAQTENVVGFFVKILLLRTNLSGDPSFREIMRRVRDVVLGAYAHRDVLSGKMLEALEFDREPRNRIYSQLFRVAFGFNNFSQATVRHSELAMKLIEVPKETIKNDLRLFISGTPEGLRATALYNTDLFDAATIARLLKHYQIILGLVIANPEQPLAELLLLAEGTSSELKVMNADAGD